MAYFDVCQQCGAALDPGEKCDCVEADAPPRTLQPGQVDCRIDPVEVFALSY